MGCSMSITLCCIGAAYGIAKSAIGISAVSVFRPDQIVKSDYLFTSSLISTYIWPDLMPPIMAGIVAIYGLVISVLISSKLQEKSALHTNFLMLGAGLSVGISGIAAGFSIGIIGDAGVRGTAQQPKLYVGMVLILIFAEVLGKFTWDSSFRLFHTDCYRLIRHDHWDNDVESIRNKCYKVLLEAGKGHCYLHKTCSGG